MEASVGLWRAGVLVDESRCRFEPVGWLSDADPAGQPLAASRSATLELRRAAGGVMPWALLGATYEPNDSGALTIRVAHSGEVASAPLHEGAGLLGRPLACGLPKEFAEATLDGLIPIRSGAQPLRTTRHRWRWLRRGDSSQFAFEHAASLLKWVLLGVSPDDALAVGTLEELLRRFG